MAIQQGFEWLRALDEHHLPGMDPAHKRALCLWVEGKTLKEIAQIEGVSGSTMRARLSVTTAEIAMCLPDGAAPPAGTRGYWTGVHLRCCLAEVVQELMGRLWWKAG